MHLGKFHGAIVEEIFRYAREQGLPVTEVTLWETERAAATYQEPLAPKASRGLLKSSAFSPLRAVSVGTVGSDDEKK